ncbi:MAG: S49 family peptidase [Chlamydiia bacterium]|nr:S49 family peptidase [Chlamydiia bacterium]
MELKRESIFVSAVRSFCNVFAGFIGILIALFVIGIIVAAIAKPQMVSDKTQMIIAADADGNRTLLSHSAPAVLRLNIHGVIGSRDLNSKTVQSQLLDSRGGMLKGDRVKAILLHINSPGGTAFDAHDIYQSLIEYKEKYKVPIYAYINGMCASGGMMIACAADKIISSPIGIIGSVGVLMGPNFNVADLMERYGVKQLTITKGKDKDMLSPFRPWQAGEDKSLKDIVAYDYDVFVNLVAKARPRLSQAKLVNEYGAQVYDPIKAQEYGYIDEANGSYSKALAALVEEASISEPYQVVELKILHPVLSDLIEGKSSILSGKIKHELSLPSELSPELMNRSLYLYSPSLQWSSSDD